MMKLNVAFEFVIKSMKMKLCIFSYYHRVFYVYGQVFKKANLLRLPASLEPTIYNQQYQLLG